MSRRAAGRPTRLLAYALWGTFFIYALVLLWAQSWNRPFQVDEVEHVHAAYNVSIGKLIYEDFRQTHNPLLYFVLGPLVDPGDPVGTFRRARSFTTALLMVHVALCGLCAWRLAGAAGGLLAAGLALVHTTFAERGLEVRTDGPMALCVTAALWVELSGLERLRRYCLEALLLAVAFLTTNKASFACFAFGCLWLAAAARHRRFRLVALPMAVWILPLALAAAAMAAAGNLEEWVALNFVSAFDDVTRAAPHSQGFDLGPAARHLARESGRNLLFCVLAVAGGLVAARRGLVFPVFLAAVLFASIWLNPFPYPYFHVTALPASAVLAGVAGARLCGALRLAPEATPSLFLALAVLAGAAAQSVPFLVGRAAPGDQPQFEALREIRRVTEPDDAVFDMVGLYFRPDASRVYLMTGVTLQRYRRGRFPRIADELRRSQAVAFVYNYRIGWLTGEEKRFLEEHFTHYDGNLSLLGSMLPIEPGESMTFEVLKAKPFRYDGRGAILVDGRPFRRGWLERGPHVVTRVERAGRDRLIMDTPPPIPWPPRPPVELYDVFR